MSDEDLDFSEDDESGEQSPGEPDDAADPRRQKRRETRLARLAREEAEFARTLLRDPVGRRFLWKILKEGGCFENIFACGPNGFPQTEATWFAAGKKDLVQRLHQTWQVLDYEGSYRMMCENDPRFAKALLPRKGEA